MSKKIRKIMFSMMSVMLLLAPCATYGKSIETNEIAKMTESVDYANARGMVFRGEIVNIPWDGDATKTFYYDGLGKGLLDFNLENHGDTFIYYIIVSPDGQVIKSGERIEPDSNDMTFDIKLPKAGTYEVYMYNDHKSPGINGVAKLFASIR